LCDVGALGGEVSKEEWFRVYTVMDKNGVDYRDGRWWFRDLPLTIGFGIDPAVADEGETPERQQSKFALVVLGVHKPTRMHCLLHYVDQRVDWPTQLKLIEEAITQWQPRIIGIEEVAYQRVLKQAVKQSVARMRHPGDPEIIVRGVPNVLDKYLKFVSLPPTHGPPAGVGRRSVRRLCAVPNCSRVNPSTIHESAAGASLCKGRPWRERRPKRPTSQGFRRLDAETRRSRNSAATRASQAAPGAC
jgi:hypothetical protein